MLYAVIRIQAVVRGFLVRLRVDLLRHPEVAIARRLALQNAAATDIQRVARGSAARKLLARRVAAATLIQSVYRRHLGLHRALQARRVRRVAADAELMDYAARTLQRFMASLVARRRGGLSVYKAEVRLLQRAGRAFRVRRVAGGLFHAMVSEAAVDIQRMFRGWYARNHQVAGLVSAHKRAMEEALQQHAACIVTRAFRRAKMFADQRSEVLRTVAATEIQRIVRGHSARVHYKDAVRRDQHDMLEQLRGNAATVIQTRYRGHVARVHYAAELRLLDKTPLATPRRGAGAGVGGGGVAGCTPQVFAPPSAARIAAACTLQRFYRAAIRARNLLRYVRRAAARVTRFMHCVSARRALQAHRRRQQAVACEAERDARAGESDLAQRRIRDALVVRRGARRGVVAGVAARVDARSLRLVALAVAAEEQAANMAATAVQRFVRGHLVRRYLAAVRAENAARDARAAQAAAVAAVANAPLTGVTSYDAACALRKYDLKHGDRPARGAAVAATAAASAPSSQ